MYRTQFKIPLQGPACFTVGRLASHEEVWNAPNYLNCQLILTIRVYFQTNVSLAKICLNAHEPIFKHIRSPSSFIRFYRYLFFNKTCSHKSTNEQTVLWCNDLSKRKTSNSSCNIRSSFFWYVTIHILDGTNYRKNFFKQRRIFKKRSRRAKAGGWWLSFRSSTPNLPTALLATNQ